MSRKSLLAFAAGTAGALLLGYCIYYDRKRRSDPDYKRKVHERRQKTLEQSFAPFEPIPRPKIVNTFELDDHEKLQHYFQNEIKMAGELFRQGQRDEGLLHLANAIKVCAEPVALLEATKLALPEGIYNLLLQRLPELHMSNSADEAMH